MCVFVIVCVNVIRQPNSSDLPAELAEEAAQMSDLLSAELSRMLGVVSEAQAGAAGTVTSLSPEVATLVQEVC